MASWIDEDKKKCFLNDCPGYLHPKKEWVQEYNLCDCFSCPDFNCKARGKHERFPFDAGGGCQCLNYAKSVSDYAFRNPNGMVIIIPEEVVKAIAKNGIS